MKKHSLVKTLAKCVCTAVLLLGFTVSVAGCAEQTSGTQCTKPCPADCKKPCCKKAGEKKCGKPCPHHHKKAEGAAEK